MPRHLFHPFAAGAALMLRLRWSAKLAWVGVPLLAGQALCATAALGLVPPAGTVAVGLALSGVGVFLGLAMYFSLGRSLKILHEGVAAVSGGDLSRKIELPGRDELSTIAALVEAMNARLSGMVAEIRNSAVRVGLSGQVVASSSETLAERTEQQASSLRQTVATVQELSTAAAANAQAANQLDQLTERLKSDAEAGGA